MNLFIWLIIAICEALRHTYLIRVEKISPNNVVICGAYFFSGWFIHDTILAVFAMKEKPWYLNGTGPIDRMQSGWLPVWWFFKGLFALTFSAMYFFN